MSWLHKSLDELGSVSRGRSRHRPRDAAHLYGGPYPFIQTGDVKRSGLYITEYSQTYSEAGLAQSRLWKAGTLCITIAANIADTGILGMDACFPDSIIGFLPDPQKADARFVKYLFDAHLQKQYQRFTQGATQDNLSQAKLLSVRFPVPAMAEQRRIADALAPYDLLIESNRRRIQLLEQAARLLYKEWFVHLRFPGHEHVTVKSGVPDGWRKAPLQEVCARITDGSHSSPRSVDDGFPMASVKDMHDWGFHVDQCRRIGREDFDALVKSDCKPLVDDVLIAKDGSYLKHTFVMQEEMDLVILSSIAILRPNDLIDPHLLNFVLRDPRTKARMSGYVSGVALPRIILKEFRGFEILLPPVELQGLWAGHVRPIARQCHQLWKINEVLASARNLLLPRLMAGGVAV
jgi:type I restriction enzyme S subunit